MLSFEELFIEFLNFKEGTKASIAFSKIEQNIAAILAGHTELVEVSHSE